MTARQVFRAAVAAAVVTLALSFTAIQEVWSIVAFMVCISLLMVSLTVAVSAWDEERESASFAYDSTEVHAAR